jgi:cytochrome c biogenesis protein CcdA
VRLAVLPVMAAGLVDGINPCAFTTLIFLLASLALAGKGRREVLAIGALFSLGVFLTYLAVGLGLFAALRAASGVALVSSILRWALFAALVVFAALSVYDYFLIRAGKASEMLLQLPNALKGRIHASIRTRARSAALAGSSLVLGFLVSIFEFACTGQVYLPTLAYLARMQKRTDALGLLLVYNLCFIAPLLVVFAASYFGVSSKRITVLFQKRMGAVKLALAAAFLGLAVLTLLT